MRRIEKGLTGPNINTAINPANYLTAKRRAATKGKISSRREAEGILAGGHFAENDVIVQANKNNDQFWLAVANPELAGEKVAGIQRKIVDPSTSESDKAGLNTQLAGWNQAILAASQVHDAKAVKMTAAQGLAATGYQWSAHRKGYNELAETMANITGAELVYQRDANGDIVRDARGDATILGATGREAGTYSNAMNNAQFGLKNAGRFEFGGINGGAGWDPNAGYDKSGGYTAGQAKKEYYQTGAMEFLGALEPNADMDTIALSVSTGLANGTLKPADVGRWHDTLLDAQQSPIRGNKTEITKQLDALKKLGTPGVPNPNAPPAVQETLGIMDRNLKSMRSRGMNIDDIVDQQG